MSGLPISLLASYVAFSFFLFYQQLHVKNFRGSSQGFLLALNLFALAAMIFGYGFLIYWAISVSWVHALILFAAGLAVKFVWFPLEARLGLRQKYFALSLLGFIVLPVCGVFMVLAVP